jgi:hypothetical protein
MGSDKGTQYILQLFMFDHPYILTSQPGSLHEIQFKMLKISILFVLLVVAVLFVAGKYKFKIYSNTQFPQTYPEYLKMKLTLSLLKPYIYGDPSKARNLTSYIYGRDFLLGILLLEPCISLIYA